MINKLELINPFNGEKFKELPYHSWQEVKSRLITADNSQQEWMHTKISERIQLVKEAMVYFHENQASYPWSPNDRDIQYNRDTHYGFINYVSALTADHVFFNSEFHMNSFLNALPSF